MANLYPGTKAQFCLEGVPQDTPLLQQAPKQGYHVDQVWVMNPSKSEIAYLKCEHSLSNVKRTHPNTAPLNDACNDRATRTDSTTDLPTKPVIFFTNVSFVPHTTKDSIKKLSFTHFSCLQTAIERCRRGGKGLAPYFLEIRRELISKPRISLENSWGVYYRTSHGIPYFGENISDERWGFLNHKSSEVSHSFFRR